MVHQERRQQREEEVLHGIDQRVVVMVNRDTTEQELIEADELHPARLHHVGAVTVDSPTNQREEANIVEQDANAR